MIEIPSFVTEAAILRTIGWHFEQAYITTKQQGEQHIGYVNEWKIIRFKEFKFKEIKNRTAVLPPTLNNISYM